MPDRAGNSSACSISTLAKGAVKDVRYHLLPVFADLLKPDPAMQAADRRTARAACGEASTKSSPTAGELLYRRGNFNGTMDQVICDALRA